MNGKMCSKWVCYTLGNTDTEERK